jgi:hypothetical protein
MCPTDVDTKAELAKLPALLREMGWSCTEVKPEYPGSAGPGDWVQGSSGPTEGGSGEGPMSIRVMTGVPFQVIAREEDLKVRVGWPAQGTTTYSCSSADQVVWWLGKILDMAEKDIADRRRNLL